MRSAPMFGEVRVAHLLHFACLRPLSCDPIVASVSGLSIFSNVYLIVVITNSVWRNDFIICRFVVKRTTEVYQTYKIVKQYVD